MSDTTIDAWLCKNCNDVSAGYNLPSDDPCVWCGKAKPDVVTLEKIGMDSPSAKQLLERHNQTPPNRVKTPSKGISEASKRLTTKQLYQRVNWDAFTDNMIVFSVMGKPIAKERPRLGRGGTYTPTKTKDYEKLVNRSSRAAMQDKQPLTGLLQLSVMIFRADGKHADIDNILKSVMDGMAGAVYYNDSQVAELDKVRVIRYAATECVMITIREFAQYPVQKKVRKPRLERTAA